ncbi:sel1 repeat family protein, partial [bacterium]|nr:sel1 repeat family protein [bacterium]
MDKAIEWLLAVMAVLGGLGCDSGPQGLHREGMNLLNEGKAKMAIEKLTKAGGEGYVPSQLFLAKWYSGDKGGAPDPKKAFEWWNRAGDLGTKAAYFELGKAFEEGLGIEKNITTARYWYRKSLEAEDPKADHRLAEWFLEGNESPSNRAEQERWLKLLSKEGNLNSIVRLGDFYRSAPEAERN